MASSTQAVGPSAKTVYYAGEYPSGHWAVQPYRLEDPNVVALARYGNKEYAFYVNPTDRRGYRSIVRFINNDDMTTTINREYSREEHFGLSLVVQLVKQVYRQIQIPIVQTAEAGNNAHKFDSATRITYLGHPKEPSFLHCHIIGRGDPLTEYIDGVTLEGPEPGAEFDMSNDTKVKWAEGQMQQVVGRLKSEIESIKQDYEALGLTVITG